MGLLKNELLGPGNNDSNTNSSNRLHTLSGSKKTTKSIASSSSRISSSVPTELNSSNESCLLNNNLTAESSTATIPPQTKAPQSPRKSTSYHHPVHQVTETTYISLEYDPVKKRKILNSYEILRDLGEGQHGKVKLAMDLRNGEKVAVKILDRGAHNRMGGNSYILWNNYNYDSYNDDECNTSNNSDNYYSTRDPGMHYNPFKHRSKSISENEIKISKEIEIMKKCNHENVVKLWEVIDDRRLRKIYLVLEYLDKGEIEWQADDNSSSTMNDSNQELAIVVKHKPVLSFKETRKIFRDVILGLEYLHHQGIVHRDIKPSNLLISKDGVVKISDFGVSFSLSFSATPSPSSSVGGTNSDSNDMEEFKRYKNEQDLCTTAGTPAFYAPELCSTDKLFPISHKLDIWSLGVTLYCLMFGELPFSGKNNFELFENINNCQPYILSFKEFQDFNVKDNDSITEDEYYEFTDLLRHLLVRDPSSRFDISEIKRHPFVLKSLDSDEEKFRFDNNILIHCGPEQTEWTNICDQTIREDYVKEQRNDREEVQQQHEVHELPEEIYLDEQMADDLRKLDFGNTSVRMTDNGRCSANALPTATISSMYLQQGKEPATAEITEVNTSYFDEETPVFKSPGCIDSDVSRKSWKTSIGIMDFTEKKKDSVVSLPVNSSYASLNSFDDNLIYEGVAGNAAIAGRPFPKTDLRDIEASSSERVYVPRMSRILDEHGFSEDFSSDEESSEDEGELVLNFGTRNL